MKLPYGKTATRAQFFCGFPCIYRTDIHYISAMLDINSEFFNQNCQQNLFFIIFPNCVFVAYLLTVIFYSNYIKMLLVF